MLWTDGQDFDPPARGKKRKPGTGNIDCPRGSVTAEDGPPGENHNRQVTETSWGSAEEPESREWYSIAETMCIQYGTALSLIILRTCAN